MAAQLRAYLALVGEDAHLVVDRIDSVLVEEVHAVTCKKLGIRAESSNNAGHPWGKRGNAKNQRI